MTAAIPELWSAADRRAEASLALAARDADLLGALLAIEGAADDDAARARAWIESAAARVMAALDRGAGASAQSDDEAAVAALVSVLVDEERLVGAASDYYAADNSRLTRVLARRAGQPILIASVWLLVARRAGLAAEGIGLPGHFVARVGGRLVDPFAGGASLSEAQCRELVARALPGRPFDASWLAPSDVPTIAVRVLRNLAHALRQAQDAPGLYRAVRLLAGLAPEDGPAQLELARLTEDHGAWPEALALYRRIAKGHAGRREGQIAELKAIELEARSRTLN